MQNAKKFLMKNSTESKIVAAKYLFINETKLNMWWATREKRLNRKKFFRKRLHFETDNLILITVKH